MANHLSLTKPQCGALKKLMDLTVGTSIDALVKQFGQEDAFRIIQMKQRLDKMNFDEDE